MAPKLGGAGLNKKRAGNLKKMPVSTLKWSKSLTGVKMAPKTRQISKRNE